MRTDYNARGYRSGLTNVTDTENPAALETFDAMNAYGQIRQQTYGNGVVTAREFDAKSGRLTDIDTTRGTTKIQDNTYAWRTNGILASRLDESGATAKEETFGYDALDRLKSATTQLGDLSETMNPAERTLSYAYDKLGNLTGRTSTVTGDRGIGGTSFGDGTAAPGPNALTGATIGADAYALAHDAGGKVTRYDRTATGDDTFIGWNARGLVETVVVGDSADDADPTTKETFAYGPDGRRYHRESVWKDGGVSRTDHAFYAGAVEERLLDGHAGYASVQRTRVGGGIVQVRTLSHPDAENKGEQTAESNLEYLHRDHLGSIEAVTNASGAELLTLAYDPFGARRKADWTRSLNPAEIDTLADDLRTKVSRGYSDHEHLDRAGFVHMNGRVYDPRTGRFLSPDPIVEDPAFSQSWHSYSYVANSPLSLVDPTGLSFAPCPLSNPVNMGGYCAPASSPGVFGGKIQTIISNIHRVRFEVFVYDTLVFGTAGDIPGEHEYVFDVLSVIRVLVSVESETVERQVPVDDQNEADEPLDAQVSEEGWYRRLLGKRYERMLAHCVAIHGPEECNEDTWRELMPAFEALPETIGAGTVGKVAGKVATSASAARKVARGPSTATMPRSGWEPAPRPRGVPENWVATPSDRGGGTKFVDPSNPHNHVRVMAGNPSSPYPNSRRPYVRLQLHGQAIDNAGNAVSRTSADAHIPLEDFIFPTR